MITKPRANQIAFTPTGGGLTDIQTAFGGANGAENISWEQSGSPTTGVLAERKTKDVSTKLSEFISVKDFGAVGDGIVDDTSAIQATLVAANGRRVLFESGKTYLITSQLIYSGNVDIESDGATPATIFHNGQSFDPIKFTGSFLSEVQLASNQQIHNHGWTVTSVPSNIKAGTLVEVISSASWYHDPRPDATDARKSELHRVSYVIGNTIYMEDPANDGYDVALETVTLKLYQPISVNISNIEVRCVLPSPQINAPSRTGIIVAYANQPVLADVNVVGAAAAGISLRGCYNAVVSRGLSHSSNAFGTGYGVQVYGCAHSIVQDRSFWQCRRGVDVSGAQVISRHTLIESCTNMGGGVNSEGTVYGWGESPYSTGAPQYGFGTHGPADHTIYRNNRVSKMHNAFVVRGRNEIIDSNYIVGQTRFGAIALSFGENVSITNNVVYSGWESLKNGNVYDGGANKNTRRPDWFIRVAAEYQGGTLQISNNQVEIQTRFISFDDGAFKPNVRLVNNQVLFATSSGTDPVYLAYNEGVTSNAVNWSIEGNILRRSSGSGSINQLFNITLGSSTLVDGSSYSGVWTPSVTSGSNIGSVTVSDCMFMRVGNMVHVGGQITIVPSVAATNTTCLLSLPITSKFTAGRQCAGSFIATTANTDMIASGVIYPDTATDNMLFRITPPTTTSLNYQFQAIYTIA